MFKKSKEGISLIILVITIIVMFIILGVVVINGDAIFGSTKKTKFFAEVEQVQSLMRTYVTRKGNIGAFETTTFDTSELTEDEKAQFNGETLQDDIVTLYVINLAEIDAEETNYGKGTDALDRYLYSETTKRVYYEKGLTVDQFTYYTSNR